jgi:hypothetical protein
LIIALAFGPGNFIGSIKNLLSMRDANVQQV